MLSMRNLLNPLLEPLGYQLFRSGRSSLGINPYSDMRRITGMSRPTVFDVGANVGQTIAEFQTHFRNPIIHCFEPTPSTFTRLLQRCGGQEDVHLNNVGLANRAGELGLHRMEQCEMNSFLPPAEDAGGDSIGREVVPVTTVDSYCAEHAIDRIDVLKTDAQGFDLEVIKGASQMISENRVHLVYMELIFSQMYDHVPRFDEIYRHLADNGFELVCFYRFTFQHERAAVSDAMFVNPHYQAARAVRDAA